MCATTKPSTNTTNEAFASRIQHTLEEALIQHVITQKQNMNERRRCITASAMVFGSIVLQFHEPKQICFIIHGPDRRE